MNKIHFKLNTIDINDIKPNKLNPRGINILEEDDRFEYLKKSIDEFGGIAVPIVVQKDKADNKYILLDGERRYWALRELGIKKVPANITEDEINEDTARNIMFHLHTNSEPWTPYQQCKSLEPLYTLLKTKYPTDEKQIALELRKQTAAHPRTVSDRLRFLRQPEKIKNIVSADPELYWTVVEIEGGIIEPAIKNFPDYFTKVNKDDIRYTLLKKYIDGNIHSATEVRKIKYIVRTERDDKKYKTAKLLFAKLIDRADYTFDDARDEFLSKYPYAEEKGKTLKKICRQIDKIIQTIEDIDVETISDEKKEDQDYLYDSINHLLEAVSEISFILNENKKTPEENKQ